MAPRNLAELLMAPKSDELAAVLAPLFFGGQPLASVEMGQPSPAAPLGLRGATELRPAQKSPYERTLAEGETRTSDELRDMLAEVILAGAPVEGITSPRAVRQYAPASARLSKRAELVRRMRTESLPTDDFLRLKEEVGTLERESARRGSRVNWKTVESLPVTEDPKSAGYIRPDGALLDLSGGSGSRAEDHRIVGGTAGMQELVGRHGFVRYSPESNGLNIAKEPTPEQLTRIVALARATKGEMVLDLEKGLGRWDQRNEWFGDVPKKSFEFSRGTDPNEIVGTILDFYGQ